MRVTIGMVVMLGIGLSVTVALAQGPTGSRGASLLPPQALGTAEASPTARAAAPELPPFPDSTPVARPATKNTSGPAWLSGTDPNVRTAAAAGAAGQPVRMLTPPVDPTRDEPSMMARGFDKIKGAIASIDRPTKSDRPTGPITGQPGNTSADHQNTNPESPFRGTTAAGAPVYAGPPAYRWYGWGSVTPGANPYAPTGHYPRASANWYAITGATPGAFPVPVMNPLRPTPGTEPPAYAALPGPRTAPPPTVTYTPPPMPEPTRAPSVTPPAAPAPTASLPPPPADLSKFGPAEVKPLPSALAPPVVTPPVPKPSSPVGIPTLAAPPGAPTAVMPVPDVAPEKDPAPKVTLTTTPVAEAQAVPPPAPMIPPLAVEAGPVVDAEPRAPVPSIGASPASLPVSVTDDQPKWQRTPERAAGGEWTPASKPAATPATPQVPATAPAATPETPWQQPGATNTRSPQPVARGQAAEPPRPDLVAALIRQLCDGRAEGVDVRWTGTRRVTVCFECRTAPVAQQLVKEISGRPELAPLQIDFCVLVK